MTNKPTYEELERRIKELEKESAKHKQAMAALQASEEKWGSLTKYSPDHIMVLNTDYSIQYINYTVPDLMIEQVIGKSCLDFVPLDYHQVATECFERVKKTGKLDQYETLYITAEGEKQYFNVRITPLMGECGSIIGLISVSNNITERKRAEEELRKHRDHLEELIAHRTQELQRVNEELQIEISERKRDQEILKESERYLNEAQTIANLGHWKLDPETKEVSGSDELFRIFGLGRDKFTLDAFVEVVHPDDREYDLSHIQRGMEQGEPWDIEHRLFLKNGTLKYVHAKGEVITDETGKPVMLVGTIQDITERKHAEEELRESEQFLSQVISQNPFPIWIGDSKGTLIKCNKALLDLLQLEENQLIGQYNILNDPLVKHLHEDIRKIFDKGENFKFEVQWEAQPSLGVDSSVVIIAGVVFPIMNQKGEVANIVATYNDITALRKSEETFRAIVEHVPVMIDSFDENGNCIIWNKELEKQLGYTISEVNESNNALELVYPKEEAEKILENILRKDCKFRFFYPTSKNGEKKIQEWADFALPDGRGVSIGVDITDRKRTEEALNEHQELIHSIVETSQDWIWSINLQGVHTYCNPAIEIILGYRPDELVGKPSLDLMHDEDRKLIEQNLPKWIAKKSGWTNLMIRWQHKDGTWRYLEGNAVPILNAQGDLTGFRGVDRDITERKLAEEELRETKGILQAAMDSSQAAIAIADAPDGKLRYVNNAGLFIRGGSEEELVNDIAIGNYVSSWGILHLDGTEYKEDEVPLARAIMYGETCSEEFVIRRPDGEDRIVWANAAPILDEEGDVKFGIVVFFDITERKQAEDRLQRIELLMNTTQQLSKIGGWEWDLKEQTHFWTEQMYRIYDFEPGNLTPDIEAHLQRSMECYDLEDLPVVMEAMRKCTVEGQPYDLEFPFTTAKGHRIWIRTITEAVMEGDRIIKLVGSLMDITKHKQAETEKAILEEQLRQAQKMEAIGTLAGGIAHDFNNILGIIVGNTELAFNDVPEWNPARYKLEEVRKASLRARDMVKQILSFSRQDKQEVKPIRVSSIIEEALKMLRSSIPTTIEIRQNYSAQADTILADPTQINQILMNLCTNANHAMQEDGGILEVGLKNIDLDEKDVALYHDLTPGKYIVLEVSDTGHGMESDVVGRIFYPFYTTKAVDIGTGLGLSVVHGIVKNHNGAIHVYSEPGKGTVFKVFFPLIESETAAEATSSEPLPAGTERILFVDDEEALADLGGRMLQHLGYEVTVRTSSIEALEAFKAQPDKFDLLLTDMTMPNMTGKDLAKKLLRIRPDFPIVLCTGFSEMITAEKSKQMGIKGFVMKPLVMREIAETIRQVLDQKKE